MVTALPFSAYISALKQGSHGIRQFIFQCVACGRLSYLHVENDAELDVEPSAKKSRSNDLKP